MLKNKLKRLLAVAVSAVIICGTVGVLSNNTACMVNPIVVKATQSMSGNFWGGYSLTGNGAADIVNVAMAQNNRSQASIGYSEAWCADFVSDCAKLANQSSAVPFSGSVQAVYNGVINAGGSVVTSPQAGDLVIYNGYCHIGIMVDSTNSIQGNVGGQVYYMRPSSYIDVNGASVSFFYVRPNYAKNDEKWYDAYDKVNLGEEFYANIENTAFDLCLSYSESNVLAEKSDDSEKQVWHFIRQSDGGYSILNQENGKSLDIANFGKDNGTNVQMVTFSGNTAQHFYLYHTVGGFLIRPACSDLVFDLESFNNYNLATYPLDQNLGNKTFSIIKQFSDQSLVDLGDNFDARIENPTLKKFLTANGNNVSGEAESSDATQLWHFKRYSDGSYGIISVSDGRGMDVSNYGSEGGTNIKLMGHIGNNAQKFFIYELHEKYLFRPACSGLVFDLESFNSYNLATYPLDDYYDNKLFFIHKKEEVQNSGDLNADGEFNVADAVLLQKWLLAVPDTNLPNWKAADMCEDNRLDVFDLCMMKRKLIYG